MAGDRYIEDKELWDREFSQLQIIPSSTRMAPSKALVLFSELLGFGAKSRVLEPGCGTGRNSIYLARRGCEVHAIDFSNVALKKLSDEAERTHLAHKIHVYKRSLADGLPFDDGYFDSVIDSYVFCHFIDETTKTRYRDEVHRVLKRRGVFFCSVFSESDEYYSPMERVAGHIRVVVDPANGIRKQLYSEKEIKTFLGGKFELPYFVRFEFTDSVQGRPYRRDIYVLIGEKV